MQKLQQLHDYLNKKMYLPLLFLTLLIMSFCFESPQVMFYGYQKIMLSSSILLTDYFAVGGMGATFFNGATVLLFNMLLLRLLRVDYSGPVFAGLMMIVGFSFFGKNLINTLPIYLGIFIHCYLRRTNVKSLAVLLLFSSGISPLVSYCIFGANLALYYGIPLGIVCGLVAGFILPALVGTVLKFTGGYNLYNVGFALGVISVFFYGLFNLLGFDVNLASLIDNTHRLFLILILFSLCALFILYGLSGGKKVLKEYWLILKESGRLISDFKEKYSNKAIFLNMGILGLASSLLIYFIRDIPVNGIMFGTVISIIGFAAYGIHIRNVFPLWLGAFIYILISPNKFNSISTGMALFFVTSLAPLAGTYGIIVGIIAGFCHLLINPFFISFQGGFDLYNNGFCAGFVAFFIHTIMDYFFWRKKFNKELADKIKQDN